MTEETSSYIRARDPFFERVLKGSAIYGIQTVSKPLRWIQGLSEWCNPPPHAPNIIKSYACRPYLPVHIFFPKSYDQTSPQTLPTLFSIHGGGFCVGEPGDDDLWNSTFTSMHDILVIELNYSKAPWSPYPTALYDLEALILAVIEDESLPIDKSRTAVGGFSAGGNLTLSLVQLDSVREKVKPAAAASMYGVVDLSPSADAKTKTRYYKPDLSPRRNSPSDFLKPMAAVFDWSYTPVGQDLRDPLFSPYFAPREKFPTHLFFCSAELDMLAHEGWRMAHKMAGKPEPGMETPVGRKEPAKEKGKLELNDERFSWDWKEAGGKGQSVKWILVPDVVHGFDFHLKPYMLGDEESVKDAEAKSREYMKILGEWLFNTAWKR